jgi:phosphoglycolate phosphatase-like HAD superfamily hydrolase
MRLLIIDLDNTIVDSLHLKPLRDARRWPAIYPKIPTLQAFHGITDALKSLRLRNVRIAVVTHSPRPYAEKVLAHLRVPFDTLICYHDLNRKLKPHPYGYQLACAGTPLDCVLAVGDEARDLQAADALGCKAALAGWTREPQCTKDHCIQRKWQYLTDPSELLDLFEQEEK